MANTLLTPTAVTREALRILHQKLNFIGSINRQYDSKFANEGAKIGSSLTIRLPNQYVVTDGAVMTAQDTTETSVVLNVTSQKHVGMNFSTAELALSIDDFSKRIIAPAMTVLAAKVEADALTMYKDVYQQANQSTITAALTGSTVLAGGAILDRALAPTDPRTGLLSPQNRVDLVDGQKALFNAPGAISTSYKKGTIGEFAGFDFMSNSLLPKHTSGTETVGTMQVNGANQTGASVTVTNGSSKTLKQGDVVTFVGCNRVHPETKADTGILQQFVVTADVATSGTSIPISPNIVVTGATQNVAASPTTAQTIVKVAGASGIYDVGLLYHEEAFTFATADLVMPKGVDFADRRVQDGISLRVVRQYDINNDKLPCRVDILYGFKTIRAALACRTASNSTA